MKLVVLVQAHKNPSQIARMLKPFKSEKEVDIYVNIDLKSSIEPFKKAIKGATFIKNRVPIYWSNLSQVQGMLNSWEEILEQNQDFEYLIFMSGQDYLLRPLNELVSFLKEHRGKQFLEYEDAGKKGLNWTVRYEKYHFTHLGKFRQQLGRIFRQFPIAKKNYPIFEKVYGGSAWFMLTKEAIEYMLDFCKKNPDFVNFHRYTHCPDEFIFQTILVNSHFKENIVNKNYWYLDWFNTVNNPKNLTSIDFDRIQGSNNFFARKFDVEIDSHILDLIDGHRENRDRKQNKY